MVLSRRLDSAELWLRDGIDVCLAPAFFQSLDADVSQAQSLIETARGVGLRITWAHVFVRAAALALAAHPDLHRMVCGRRIHNPERVDIALSVAGELFAAPLLVIEGADRKSLPDIAGEIARRTPEVRQADRETIQALRRWGWLAPFRAWRRLILRGLFRNPAFRRGGAGTFQVSVVPGVDQVMSPVFSASAVLFAGEVKDRVIAVNGKPAVRPTATLTCCADHRVWNGGDGRRFLGAVQKILQSPALFDEICGSGGNLRSLAATAAGSKGP